VKNKQPTHRTRAPQRKTELGELLTAKRKAAGLTLRQAAERVGVGHSTLSDLEKGVGGAEFETLVGIHRGYGVPLEELVRIAARDAGAELPAAPTGYVDRAASLAARAEAFPDLAQILDRLAKVDPAGYRAFLLMLELWERQNGPLGEGQP